MMMMRLAEQTRLEKQHKERERERERGGER